MASQFECFGVDNVDVGGRHGENDTVGFCNVFCDQVASLFFDITGLVTNGDLFARRLASAWQFGRKVDFTLVRPGKSTSVKLKTWDE